MLEPQQALARVLESTCRSEAVAVPLSGACDLVSAAEVAAPEPYPFFSNSAMDGYAVRCADLQGASEDRPVTLPLAGEVRAGPGEPLRLQPGTTIRIMTGGSLPGGADAVVKREDVREGREEITFFQAPGEGSFINRRGEEIGAGTLLWPAGRRINPAALGLFAAMGIGAVEVFPAPGVSLVATGDELVEAPGQRAGGQVYDSASPMLAACLRSAGAEVRQVLRCGDDRRALKEAIGRSVWDSQITITVGGVSMGEADLVIGCAEELGVERVFWKVKQKPGKPLYFGRKKDRLFFGLPGNPASALVCCLLYVLPAVRKTMGFADPGPAWYSGRLGSVVENDDYRTCFARGTFQREADSSFRLEVAAGQSSYMLGSFAAAGALIELPPGPVRLEAGQALKFTPLPWAEPLLTAEARPG